MISLFNLGGNLFHSCNSPCISVFHSFNWWYSQVIYRFSEVIVSMSKHAVLAILTGLPAIALFCFVVSQMIMSFGISVSTM